MKLGEFDDGDRIFIERLILAVVLPAVAGAVNASGFLVVGTYTSHVTGQVGRIGDELAQGRPGVAFGAAMVVLMFFAGAVAATVMIERAKRLVKARYVAPLVVEAGTLAAFAAMSGTWLATGQGFMLTGLLCFAMGLQNALVTKISGAVVRTTHLTGIVTDIGIESVRIFTWAREEVARRSLREWFALPRIAMTDPEWKKLRLHLVVLGSFFVGAIVGPEVFMRYGQVAMIVPCIVLLLLATFDLLLGIRNPEDRKQRPSLPEVTDPGMALTVTPSLGTPAAGTTSAERAERGQAPRV